MRVQQTGSIDVRKSLKPSSVPFLLSLAFLEGSILAYWFSYMKLFRVRSLLPLFSDCFGCCPCVRRTDTLSTPSDGSFSQFLAVFAVGGVVAIVTGRPAVRVLKQKKA